MISVKPKILSHILCLFMTLLIVAVPQVSAQENGPVHVEVEALKSEVITGEPILIRSVIYNRTDSSLYFTRMTSPTYQSQSKMMADVDMAYAEEPFQSWNHGLRYGRFGHGKRRPQYLTSGEEKQIRFLILYDGHSEPHSSIVTSQPGSYRFRTRMSYGNTMSQKMINGEPLHVVDPQKKDIRSDPVEVTVREANKEADQSVWRKLQKQELLESYGYLIQVPWFTGRGVYLRSPGNAPVLLEKKEKHSLRSIAENHPESTYSPYITLSLARHSVFHADHIQSIRLALQNEPERSKRLKKKQTEYLEKAKKLLKSTASNTKNHVFGELIERERNRIKKVNERGERKRETNEDPFAPDD